mmetsp:Transcript_94131/g.176965  ORF Transcript_94131/g.176965 Transcript_94131/m.176965 type:complete len:203 (-) Transcript_94131:115-723(-)
MLSSPHASRNEIRSSKIVAAHSARRQSGQTPLPFVKIHLHTRQLLCGTLLTSLPICKLRRAGWLYRALRNRNSPGMQHLCRPLHRSMLEDHIGALTSSLKKLVTASLNWVLQRRTKLRRLRYIGLGFEIRAHGPMQALPRGTGISLEQMRQRGANHLVSRMALVTPSPLKSMVANCALDEMARCRALCRTLCHRGSCSWVQL